MSVSSPSYYKETTNSPPNGGSATGAGRNFSSNKYLIGFVYSDTPGRLQIEQSPNGNNNWYVTDETLVNRGTCSRLVGELVLEWARVRFENTGGIANNFRLHSYAKGDR